MPDLHTNQHKSPDKVRSSTRQEANPTSQVEPSNLTDSSANVLRLQRTLGNRRTIQYLPKYRRKALNLFMGIEGAGQMALDFGTATVGQNSPHCHNVWYA